MQGTMGEKLHYTATLLQKLTHLVKTEPLNVPDLIESTEFKHAQAYADGIINRVLN
jgi:hypothetical protein